MFRRSLFIASLVFGSQLFAQIAHAEDAPNASAPAEQRWYGAQTLIADGAAIGVVGVAAATDDRDVGGALVTAAIGSYVLTAPIIHIAHGHVGKGIGDLGLRVGSAGVGALVGTIIATSSVLSPRAKTSDEAAGRFITSGDDVAEGMAIGAAVGALAAMAIDSALLAHEDVEKPVAPPTTAMRLKPTVAPTRSGFHAGVSWTF